jgi:23S rRNA (pseudouridine1915-N3)-methyltransferase
MKIIVSLFGEPKDENTLSLIEEYRKRTSRYQDLEFKYFKKYGGLENFVAQVATPSRSVYLLAEKGEEYDTKEFAEKIYDRNLNVGTKEIMFCIGPAEGWGTMNIKSGFVEDPLAFKNVKLLSLSKLTMQHDLAFLVLVEQIYRAVSIKNNLPYHK